MSLTAVVLAAGQGKRLKTGRAKVLHQAGGRALLDHVLAAVDDCGADDVVVVVGHLREQVEDHLRTGAARTVVQDPPRGTGDAVRCALPGLPGDGDVLVVSGDTPLLRGETLRRMVAARREAGSAAVVATAELADPGAYGRVVRDAHRRIAAIVEARDADAATLAVREVNAGAYLFDARALAEGLAAITADNAQGEYYLTDAVGHLTRRGAAVLAFTLDDPDEMRGVNTREELAAAHRLLNRRQLRRLSAEGVTVLDPDTTWVDTRSRLGRDVVLEPGVHLRGRCVVPDGCVIGALSVLTGVTLAEGEEVPPLTSRHATSD